MGRWLRRHNIEGLVVNHGLHRQLSESLEKAFPDDYNRARILDIRSFSQWVDDRLGLTGTGKLSPNMALAVWLDALKQRGF